MGETSPSDAELVRRAQDGDVDAFGLLVERHQDYVYNSVFHLVGDEKDTEDLAQEVFVRAFDHLDGFEGRSKFSTWVYGIMLNTVRSHWRRSKRRNMLSLERAREDETRPDIAPAAETDGPLRATLRGEDVAAVRSAIAELSENLREIIVLRDIRGMAYAELASVLDVPEGTVKSRLYRARQELKQLLEPYFKETQ